MSISLRIYLSMGLLVGLLVVVGTFGGFQINGLGKTFIEYRQTAKGSLVANAVAEDVFEARIASLKFRATGDPAYVEEVSANIEETRQLGVDLGQILERFPDSPSVQDIQLRLDQYESHMMSAFSLQQERNEVVGQIVNLGRKARQQLAEIMETALRDNDAKASSVAGVASSNLLLGRLYLERFLVDNRIEDAERAAKEIAEAKSSMVDLLAELQNSRRRALANLTIADLNEFADLSSRITTIISDRNAEYASMDRIGPGVLDEMDVIVDKIVAQQDTLGPAGQARAKNAIEIAVIFVALAALIGAGLAYFMGRKISRQLTAVTEDMTELANGNLDLELEQNDGQDEVSKMKNALLVFVHNAREARALDEEVKKREAKAREQEREQERLTRERDAEKQALKERDREQAAEAERMAREQEAAEVARENARRQEELEAERLRAETARAFQAQVEDVLSQAANGNLGVRMPLDHADSGMTQLSTIINDLLSVMEVNIEEIATSLNALSKGDLGVRISGDRRGSFEKVQNDFNRSLEEVAKTMGKIQHSSQTVASASAELESNSHLMSRRAEDNAGSLTETSVAVDKISSSIRQVVANTKAANESTRNVQIKANESRDIADQTQASIEAITEASGKINDVVTVIQDIAFQINLLALNAGVEAARAGEAGRGFSVVASEVRSLAQRSQMAVQEINEVIKQNNRSVEEGVEQITSSRSALEEIATDIDATTQLIAEITDAIEAQSDSIEDVRRSVASIDSTAQQNAASLEEMTASNADLSLEANQLQTAVSQFKGVADNISEAAVSSARRRVA